MGYPARSGCFGGGAAARLFAAQARFGNAQGEAVAVHLEPLTGKLIAFHVGGDR